MNFDKHTRDGSFLEQGDYKGLVLPAESIWLDSKHIPTVLPTQDKFVDNRYCVQLNGRNFCILERVENLQLNRLTDYVFTHPSLIGILTPWFNSAHYPIELKDSNGFEIPLGFVKAEVDSLGGKITLHSNSEAFKLPLFISFYKYTGRTNFEGLLDTKGLVSMDETYTPTTDQDVVTKKFMEEKIKRINSNIFDLTPKQPETLEKQPLKVTDSLGVFELLTSAQSYPVFNSEKAVTLQLSNFYLPPKGFLKLYISGIQVAEVSVEREQFNSKKELTIPFFGKLKYKDYKEYKEWVPKGYFDIADLEIHLDKDNLSKFFQPDTPIYEVKVEYYYKDLGSITQHESNTVEVGYEPDLEYNKTLLDLHLEKGGWKYVSGIVSLKDQEVLTFFFKCSPLKYFKRKDSVVAKLKVFNKEIQLKVSETYPSLNPLLEIRNTVKVEEQGDFEAIPLFFEVYNFKGEVLETKTQTLTLRYDSTSETERVNFDSTKNIWKTLDLQKLHGLFVYPQDDFSKHGQDISKMLNVQGNTFPVSANFTDSPNQTETKWAEFEYDLPLVHGFALQLVNAKNFQSDNLSEVPLNFELLVKVEGSTGWLACKPYLLGTDPKKEGDRSLVPQESSNTFKRFTFGRKSYSGKLRVLVGWVDKALSFEKIEIFPLN